MDITAVFIALYLLLLIVMLLRGRRHVSHPWLFLLRGFFPSWRFFDTPGPQPRLFVRAKSDQEQWSVWTLFIPRAEFKIINLFHNPENNLRLTEQTLVEHLSLDVQNLEDEQAVNRLVSYRLVERLAHRIAKTLAHHHIILTYQFKIELISYFDKENFDQTLLISPELKGSNDVS